MQKWEEVPLPVGDEVGVVNIEGRVRLGRRMRWELPILRHGNLEEVEVVQPDLDPDSD